MNIINRNIALNNEFSAHFTPTEVFAVDADAETEDKLKYLLAPCKEKLTLNFVNDTELATLIEKQTNDIYRGNRRIFVVLCGEGDAAVALEAAGDATIYLISKSQQPRRANVVNIEIDSICDYIETVKHTIYAFADSRNAARFTKPYMKVSTLDMQYEKQFFLQQLEGVKDFFRKDKDYFTTMLSQIGIGGSRLRDAMNNVSFNKSAFHTGQISSGGNGAFKDWLKARYGKCPEQIWDSDKGSYAEDLSKFAVFASLKVTYDINKPVIREKTLECAKAFYESEVKHTCFYNKCSFTDAIAKFTANLDTAVNAANTDYKQLIDTVCANEQIYKEKLTLLVEKLMSVFEYEEAKACAKYLETLAAQDTIDIDYSRLDSFESIIQSLKTDAVKNGKLPDGDVCELYEDINRLDISYTPRRFAGEVLEIVSALQGEMISLDKNLCFKCISDKFAEVYDNVIKNFMVEEYERYSNTSGNVTQYAYHSFSATQDRVGPRVRSFEYANRLFTFFN